MSKVYQAILFSESGNFIYSRSLGAQRIANILRDHFGWNVLILDHFTVTQCVKELKQDLLDNILPAVLSSETKFVGFSTTFMNINNKWLIDQVAKNNSFIDHPVIEGNVECLPFLTTEDAESFLGYIKQLAPNSKIVIGGVKAESKRYKQNVDAYVVGYGESQLIDLINFWQGKNPFMPIKRLSDTCIEVSHDTKGANYDFSKTPTRYCSDDLLQLGEVLPLEISRGCIFRCKFCSYPLNGKKKWDHIKDSEVLRDEFIKNYEISKTTNYIIVDDTFNDSVKKLEMFNSVVQSLPFKIQYAAYIRHDLLYAHPETEQLLRDSGLVSATFGIETLNHESGKAIGKGMPPDKTIQFLHDLKARWPELITSSGFILGLPFDNLDSIETMCQIITKKDFPLDGMNIVPLWLLKDGAKKKLYFSEFEENWKDYGYDFPGEGNTLNWKNGELTYEKCLERSSIYQSIIYETHRNKISTFEALAAMNFNYTVDSIKGLSQKEFLNNIVSKRIDYVSNFYKRLKAHIR
jgi:radical SAM superfamily enzyme YgiQ (UPF0313 family)